MFFRGIWVLLAIFTASLIFPFGAAAEEEPESQKQPSRYTRQMVLIVIDGLQTDALQKAQAPNINGVASGGVRINNCIPVWPYGLETAVASILTGTEPEAHQFIRSSDQLKQPSLFELIKKNQLKSGFFDATGRLEALAGNADHYLKIKGDEKLVQAAIKEMESKKPYLNVLVLDEARAALDKSGKDTQEYYGAISKVDNLVGLILHSLHSQGHFDQTLIMISGTDGEPPLIVKGLQFKGGVMLPPAAIVDIAPTLAYILNVKIPSTTGLVVWNAFEPGSLQNGFYLMEQRIRELSKVQVEAYQTIHGLWDEQKLVREEQQELIAKESDIAKAIQKRDQEIDGLGKKVLALKFLIGLLVVVFGFGYLVEYRWLRKRFLLF